MISFLNDYSEGAHPRVLEMLTRANLEQNAGYGEDVHSQRAKEYIKKSIGRNDVDIHFMAGGTQTNLVVISSFLRPHHCVISAETGHINVHETGAIEATGHKVVVAAGEQGKLTPESIQTVIDYHSDEHMVLPKMVYLSNSTELGTVYTKRELTAIHEVCKKNGLLLFLDGARLASALTCKENDLTLGDIARLVDVFYIGGTKNGAHLGEALVICKDELKEEFRYLIEPFAK
jgi:threonine aldolase